jgi:hypothetical protein
MSLPNVLRIIWRRWRALAIKLGHFNGLALLTIFYWVVVGIVGGFFRLFRADPLGRRAGNASMYHKKEVAGGDVARYEHLY